MSETLFICALDQLSDPGSFGFEIALEDQIINGFVVLQDGAVYAYRNSCPHTGAPLDWVEHQFLDADEVFIQCAVHDARFVIDSGECIAGPCPGEKLKPLKVRIDQQNIYLQPF